MSMTINELRARVQNENDTTWKDNPCEIFIQGHRGYYQILLTPKDLKNGSWAREMSMVGSPEEVWFSYFDHEPQKEADRMFERYGEHPLSVAELKKLIKEENRTTWRDTGIRLDLCVAQNTPNDESNKYQIVAYMATKSKSAGRCFVKVSDEGTPRRAWLSYADYYKGGLIKNVSNN